MKTDSIASRATLTPAAVYPGRPASTLACPAAPARPANPATSFVRSAFDLLACAPVTVTLFLLATWIECAPAAATALEFDHASIVHFQSWRTLTGHLTHWSADHWLWDSAMFLLLGSICEARFRRRYVACLVISAIGISIALLAAMPDVEKYRGLSGIDTALFTLAAVDFLCRALAERRNGLVVLIASLFLALSAKIAYEVATGATLFVDSTSSFIPLPEVHLVGAILGPMVLLRDLVRRRLLARTAGLRAARFRRAGDRQQTSKVIR